TGLFVSHPPAAITLPLGSKVRVNARRSWLIEPVGVQFPVAGSKSSAVRVGAKFEVLVAPPATRTFPFGSRTAAVSQRLSRIEPVKFHAPVEGSNNSALERKALFPKPPAARTFPLCNKVAVADWRSVRIAPANCQVPFAGSKSSEAAT